MADRQEPLTESLELWSSGDPRATEQVIAVVYDELRRIAASYLRQERPGHTLQATALVHEAYLQIFGQSGIEWRNRAHFLGVAARLMRRILIDYARERNAQKRGGRVQHVPLTLIGGVSAKRAPDLLALDDALHSLARRDRRQARVVEARYFGGLSVDEVAEYLEVSRATVIRDWRQAKAWLHAELQDRASAVEEGCSS